MNSSRSQNGSQARLARESRHGFSLFEALAAIAVIGVLAWVVVASQSGAPKAVALTKLESDVITVNQAIKLYVANGGSLSGITNAQAVLDKMKSRISTEDDAKQVGFGGPMIDPRLAVRYTTQEEEHSSGKRAVWDPSQLRFEVTNADFGVAEFLLDDAKGVQDYGTESRLAANSALEYEAGNGWIWSYQDTPAQLRVSPTVVAMGNPGPTSSPGSSLSPLNPPTRIQLRPPAFSIPSGSYRLSTFQLSLGITDPNSSCSSWIMYSLNGAGYTRYSAPLSVSPNTQVRAFVTGDSYLYYSSSLAEGSYKADPPANLSPPLIETSHDQFLWSTAETSLVTLSNPNDPKVSSLEYQVDNMGWNSYLAPFELPIVDHPTGAIILARAMPLTVDYLASPETSKDVQGPPPPVQLPVPVITPSAPNFMAGSVETISVTIDNPHPTGSVLDYRVNGCAWHVYGGAFNVSRATYVTGLTVEARARSTSPAYTTSSEASTAIGLTPAPLQPPVINPSSPNLKAGIVESISVTITNPNASGSVLDYRFNGGAWLAYSGAFTITRSSYPTGLAVEARARSTAPAYSDSSNASSAIGLTPVPLQAPIVSPSAPNFMAGSIETVTVTVTNPNATGSALDYRLNGGAWQAYSGAFNVARAAYPTGLAVEARARATDPAYSDSPIASAPVGLSPVQLQTPPVSPSAFNFVAGSIESITVTITNPNSTGSTLQYRVNGGSWQAYSGPFSLTRAAYPTGFGVEAVARATGPAYTDSSIGSATVGLGTVPLQAPPISKSTPNFYPVLVETVTITITNPNAAGSSALDYRLNGGPWQVYSSAFTVMRAIYPLGVTVEARARAVSPAYTDSPNTSSSVGVGASQLQKPVITPSASNFEAGSVETIAVTLLNPNPAGSSTLQYRLNGGGWKAYSSPFTVSRSTYPAGVTIDAYAKASNAAYTNSGNATVSIGLTLVQLQPPTISPSAPNFMAGSAETIAVTLANPNPAGSGLQYRINGGSWKAYSNPFNVTRTTYPTGLTIEAYAKSTNSGYTDSPPRSCVIGLTPAKLLTPTISPSAPNFKAGSVDSITVTIANPNATGSALEYRVDGGAWTPYANVLTYSRSTYPTGLMVEARARATNAAYSDSEAASSAIGLTPVPLQAPAIVRSSPSFIPGLQETVSVTLVNANPSGSALLEYRIDGGEWQSYSATFDVTKATYPSGLGVESRARATSVAYTDSPISSSQIGVTLAQLKAPTIAPSAPAFVSGSVESISVTLNNPNSSGTSHLEYRLVPVPGGSGASTEFGIYMGRFTVNRVAYSLGFGVFAYAKSDSPDYADSGAVSWFATSQAGLFGGHLDVDTSNFLSSIGNGSTTQHTHDYTGNHNVTEVDFFELLDSGHVEIDETISPATRFKLILINGSLSPGVLLKIKEVINGKPQETIVTTESYDDTPVADLPVYTLGGAPGTVQLTGLSFVIDRDALYSATVIPTVTNAMKSNVLGKGGEWRNGGLTIQAVLVKPDGTDAFTTDSTMSNGDQGVATTGFLWEGLAYWHWDGDSYDKPTNTYVPRNPNSIRNLLP